MEAHLHGPPDRSRDEALQRRGGRDTSRAAPAEAGDTAPGPPPQVTAAAAGRRRRVRALLALARVEGQGYHAEAIGGAWRRKRYILAPPEACPHLAIIADKRHPSFRHSAMDFSNLTRAQGQQLRHVRSIDTIVREGEVLYIPSFWFHYVVSLDYSIQCNSRSGFPENNAGKKDIEKCMHLKMRS